jgi:hypothetical protein
MSGGALAQTRVLNRAEVEVTARTDAGNAAGYCAIDFLLRNVGSTRLSVFAPEIVATGMRTGAALTVPTTTIALSGIEPGATRELTNFGAHGALRICRMDPARLGRIRSSTVRRAEHWPRGFPAALVLVFGLVTPAWGQSAGGPSAREQAAATSAGSWNGN